MNNNLITTQSLTNYIIKLYNENKNENENEHFQKYEQVKKKNNDINKVLNIDETCDLKNIKQPFSEIFDNNNYLFYKIGIIHSMKNDKNKYYNCSVYSSILTCILENYIDNTIDIRMNFINKFVIQILEDIGKEKLYTKFNYRSLGWKKKNLINSIRTCENNDIVIKFLSDYLNVNIFIIDIPKNKIFISYGEEKFNKFKKNYFLTCINDIYEPVLCNNITNIKFDNIPFSIIINHYQNIINIINVNFSKKNKNKNKVFTIGDENIEQYLDNMAQYSNYNVNKVITDITVNESDTITKNNDFDEFSDTDLYAQQDVNLIDSAVDTEIEINNTNNKDIFYKKYTDSIELDNINSSKKLTELQAIANKLGISIKSNIVYKNGNFKMKTKAQLITNIKEML
mgnify:CR=1 FL=1